MTLDIKPIAKVLSYLLSVNELLEKEDQRKEFLGKAISAGDNALESIGEDEEKFAYLYYAALNWANQATIFLLQENKLSDELLATYREFPLPEEAEATLKEYRGSRQAERDRINAEQKKVMDKENELNVFQAIVGGMSKEEAQAKMEEYEKQIAAAQAQTRR